MDAKNLGVYFSEDRVGRSVRDALQQTAVEFLVAISRRACFELHSAPVNAAKYTPPFLHYADFWFERRGGRSARKAR